MQEPCQVNKPLLFAGSSHIGLAEKVAESSGISLAQVAFEKFPDGEIGVQVLENVRGRDVFVLQSISLHPNRYLMELLILIDALKRASTKSIIAVIPYFGYCRQDRKDRPRVPISAKLVANLLVTAGVDHLLTMDLHAGQIEGFFDVPVDNLYARPKLTEAFWEVYPGEGLREVYPSEGLVVVAPDLGSIKLARSYASHMKAGLAIVDKTRVTATQVEVANLIGDVKGKDVLLADDMCSTGGTLVSAAKACQEKGAKRIFAVVTHGLFVGQAIQHIEESPIELLLMSDTIPYTERLAGSSKVQIVSVAPLFGQAIGRIVSQESISSLFD